MKGNEGAYSDWHVFIVSLPQSQAYIHICISSWCPDNDSSLATMYVEQYTAVEG